MVFQLNFADNGNYIHLLNQMQRLFTYRKFEILIIFLIFQKNHDMLYSYYCIQYQVAHKGD